MCYIYTVEYYSAIKQKNEIMLFAAKRMDIEMIILREFRSPCENYMTPLSSLMMFERKIFPLSL